MITMATCGSCKEEIDEQATRCNHCGYSEWTPSYQKVSSKFLIALIVTMLTLGLALPITGPLLLWWGLRAATMDKRDPTIEEK